MEICKEETFAHMTDDLEQNMLNFSGEDDLDLFGFCFMIVDDNENGEELERRMGESESDSPMSLGASFTNSENSPSLKALDEDISPYIPPPDSFEVHSCYNQPDEINSMETEQSMEEGHPVMDKTQQIISGYRNLQEKKTNTVNKEYEANYLKAKKPVLIQGADSIIVDHGFIKYELEQNTNIWDQPFIVERQLEFSLSEMSYKDAEEGNINTFIHISII